MVNGRATSQEEIEFRRRWYQAHVGRLESDLASGRVKDWLPRFRASAPEPLAIRDRLASSGDVAQFRAEQQAWASGPDAIGFKGYPGAMLINSLVKYTDGHASLARLLAAGLTPPRDRGSAAQKLDALVDHIERVKVGAHPMASNVAFMLPYFWALEQPERWPVFWRTSREFLESSTGASISGSPTERYLGFMDLVEEVDEDYERFTLVSWWAKDTDRSPLPAFLDPVLSDRCTYGRDPEAIPGELLKSNAAVLVGIARHLRDVLAKDVPEVVDHLGKPKVPRLEWRKGRPRSDFWVDWRVQGLELGLRLWVNDHGAAIGVFPGLHTPGWTNDARDVVSQNMVEGFRLMGTQGSTEGDDVGFVGRPGSFIYGRWYETDQLAGLDLRAEVRDVAIAAVQRVHYTRLNQHYQPAVGLARLLLDNLTLVDRRGATTAASFMVNMNDLFERFVTERLHRALQGRLVVRSQASDYLDTGREISIRPDLRFRYPGSDPDAYVGDVKYKLTTDAQGRTTDYYQLLAYTTALKLPEGVLIYCRTDGDKPAGEITVRNAGKKLHVHAVDMTGSPAEVAKELEQLADWIATRSEQVRVPYQRTMPTPVGVTG